MEAGASIKIFSSSVSKTILRKRPTVMKKKVESIRRQETKNKKERERVELTKVNGILTSDSCKYLLPNSSPTSSLTFCKEAGDLFTLLA